MKLPFSQTVKERPILFNTEMVKAVLEGRKTQTRRVIKMRDGSLAEDEDISTWEDGGLDKVMDFTINYPYWKELKCPYGKPGYRLWVRETYVPNYFDINQEYGNNNGYKADWTASAAEVCKEPKWKPSIFMPRHASRILLEITDIRVERVQDITESEAIAEGVELLNNSPFNQWKSYKEKGRFHLHAWQSFQSLWNSINEKRGFGWDVNPWVWVVEFKRIEMPLSEQQQLSQMQQDCFDNCEI